MHLFEADIMLHVNQVASVPNNCHLCKYYYFLEYIYIIAIILSIFFFGNQNQLIQYIYYFILKVRGCNSETLKKDEHLNILDDFKLSDFETHE